MSTARLGEGKESEDREVGEWGTLAPIFTRAGRHANSSFLKV